VGAPHATACVCPCCPACRHPGALPMYVASRNCCCSTSKPISVPSKRKGCAAGAM
jgi:hypothetical protein